MELGGFTPDQARALWQDFLTRQSLPPQQTQSYPVRRNDKEFRPRNVQVMLKTDLYAAVNHKDDPSTCEAYILRRRNGNLVNTGEVITITNRFENISIDAGTYCKAEWISGEWQLYAADCAVDSDSSGSIFGASPSIGGP